MVMSQKLGQLPASQQQVDVLHYLKHTMCKSKFKFISLPFLPPSLFMSPQSTKCSKGQLGIFTLFFFYLTVLSTNSMNLFLKYITLLLLLLFNPPGRYVMQLLCNCLPPITTPYDPSFSLPKSKF